MARSKHLSRSNGRYESCRSTYARAPASVASISGVARATEGEFDWALIDANGLILADGVAACGVGTYAPFEFVIPAGVSPGPASLLVYELAAGGSQQHALEHPVDVAGS